MSYISETLSNLVNQTAFFNLSVGNYVMIVVACIFLYLAIKKEYEPLLLVPIAFGMLLVISIQILFCQRKNHPGELRDFCISFICWMNGASSFPDSSWTSGAMTDFGPLIANPKSFLMGAAAQLVSMWLTSWRFSSVSMEKLRRRFLSSAELTDRRLFSWPASWGRHR